MSDELRRLLDGGDARIALTLRAGLRDEPSDRNIVQAARALGVSSAALMTVRRSAAAARAASESAYGASTSLTGSVLGSITKWLTIGLIVGGAATSTVAWREPKKSPLASAGRALAPTAVPANGSRSAAAGALTGPTAAAEPPGVARVRVTPTDSARAHGDGRGAVELHSEPTAEELETARQALVGEPRGARQAAAASARATDSNGAGGGTPIHGSLDTELALLSAARNALKSGAPSTALALLDRREREVLQRTMDAEAMLLRVQALVAAGRSSEARAIARAALEPRSSDGYACRVANIAGIATARCAKASAPVTGTLTADHAPKNP